MGPSWFRAAFSSAVSSTCIVFALGVADAQTTNDRPANGVDDPTPAEVRVSVAPAEGHAAAEGVLESIEVQALEAFVWSRQTEALRAAIAGAESSFLSRLAALQNEFELAQDESTAMELQRQMEALKFEHEVELVLVQAEHARTMGREQLADEAQRVATRMREDFRAEHRPTDAPVEGSNDGSKQE